MSRRMRRAGKASQTDQLKAREGRGGESGQRRLSRGKKGLGWEGGEGNSLATVESGEGGEGGLCRERRPPGGGRALPDSLSSAPVLKKAANRLAFSLHAATPPSIEAFTRTRPAGPAPPPPFYPFTLLCKVVFVACLRSSETLSGQETGPGLVLQQDCAHLCRALPIVSESIAPLEAA